MCSRTRIPFTTCFGVVHVRNALLTIIILQLLGEIIETLQYIFAQSAYVPDFLEFLFEVIESLVLVSTIYGWWKEKKEFIVPLFIQSMLATMVTLLSTVLFFVSMFFPYTAAAEAFIPPGMIEDSASTRRVFFLMCFIFVTPIAALFGWFVMTSLGAYQYYDHKEKLEAFRRSRPLPSLNDPTPSDGTPKTLALVIPSAVSTEPSVEIPATGNFGNPNFSDEEEEEEEGGDEPEEDDEEARKVKERERKKAEVRRRLEEAGRAKKAKKGFLTPERKKKLRKLLMMKAAEDLKEKQRQLELERSRILNERIIPLPDLDSVDDLEAVFEEMKRQVLKLEADTYDINYTVRQKDFEINELTIAVNDLRGKFVKPTLKKVSKTENRFDKLKKKESTKVDFRSNLKIVEKTAGIEEEPEKEKKAEWAK